MAHPFLTRIMQHDDNGWSVARVAIGHLGDSDDLQVEITFGHDAADDVEGLYTSWEVAFYLSPAEFAQAYQQLLSCTLNNDGKAFMLGQHALVFTRDEDELCVGVEPTTLPDDICILCDSDASGPLQFSGCIVSVTRVLQLFQTAQFLLAANPAPRVFT